MAARLVVLACVSAVIITGCSSGGEAEPAADAVAATASAPPASHTLQWRQPGDGQGEQGQPLQITPLGVYYHPGDDDYGRSQNGMFAAVAVKVAATGNGADHVPPPVSGFGFSWVDQDGEVVDTAAGASAPWIGRVTQPTITDIPAGRHKTYVVTFDVAGRGGTLVYTSPDGSAVQWPVPAKAGGKGLRPVLAALDSIGVKR